MIKWDHVVITANLVLRGAVKSLDLWDVFISRHDMKLGVQVGKVAAY